METQTVTTSSTRADGLKHPKTRQQKKEGKNKRAAIITTFVKDSADNEIANILHNNMFPVKEGVYSLLEIDAEVDTYESNEIRFIRKNKDRIIKKAQKVYEERTTKHNPFLLKSCCDFKELEAHYQSFIR